jgi:FliG middle domain/Flagellar hook-associated protein 2 N-terminus/FliG N-terminal domain
VADLGLSGIASGVDTAAIVEQLMALERRGKTRLQMQQGSITAQQTTLRDLKTKLDALKAAAADLRSSTTWSEVQTVESSDAARIAVARTGGAPIGGYSVQVTQLAASARKTYEWTESASAGTLDFGGGKTLDVAANAKVGDVASAINGRSDLPVFAAVVGEQLVLSSRATGETADFNVTGAQLGAPIAPIDGRDAKYLIDGVPDQSPSNVVTDAIPGVTLTFEGTTAEAASVVVGAPAVDKQKVKDNVKGVITEAVETVLAEDYLAEGGVDYARSLLQKSLGAERAEEIISRLAATIERRPFEFLRRTPPEQIHVFLRNESPQTIALVVANLHTALAAQVLSLLSPEKQADVAMRVAQMGETRPEVVAQIESVMKQKLSNVISQKYPSAGGVKSLADILNQADRSTERNVLGQLAQTNGELAEEVRLLLFTFEDVVKLDDRSI